MTSSRRARGHSTFIANHARPVPTTSKQGIWLSPAIPASGPARNRPDLGRRRVSYRGLGHWWGALGLASVTGTKKKGADRESGQRQISQL